MHTPRYADGMIGAPMYDNGESNEGRAFVYLGSVSGPSATAAWTTESDPSFSALGGAVATAGDVNDDGYSDLLVGESLSDNGERDEGSTIVYLGSPSGRAATAGLNFAWCGWIRSEVTGDNLPPHPALSPDEGEGSEVCNYVPITAHSRSTTSTA